MTPISVACLQSHPWKQLKNKSLIIIQANVMTSTGMTALCAGLGGSSTNSSYSSESLFPTRKVNNLISEDVTQHVRLVCAQQGTRPTVELTGAVEMDGSLCRVSRAIAEHKYVSTTKPAIAGRFRQARQVPQAKACRWRGR